MGIHRGPEPRQDQVAIADPATMAIATHLATRDICLPVARRQDGVCFHPPPGNGWQTLKVCTEELIRRESGPWDRLDHLGAHLSAALDVIGELHHCGRLHRNIHPRTVWLRTSGSRIECRLSDLWPIVADTSLQPPHFDHRAPETCRGDVESASTDAYGIVLTAMWCFDRLRELDELAWSQFGSQLIATVAGFATTSPPALAITRLRLDEARRLLDVIRLETSRARFSELGDEADQVSLRWGVRLHDLDSLSRQLGDLGTEVQTVARRRLEELRACVEHARPPALRGTADDHRASATTLEALRQRLDALESERCRVVDAVRKHLQGRGVSVPLELDELRTDIKSVASRLDLEHSQGGQRRPRWLRLTERLAKQQEDLALLEERLEKRQGDAESLQAAVQVMQATLDDVEHEVEDLGADLPVNWLAAGLKAAGVVFGATLQVCGIIAIGPGEPPDGWGKTIGGTIVLLCGLGLSWISLFAGGSGTTHDGEDNNPEG